MSVQASEAEGLRPAAGVKRDADLLERYKVLTAESTA